MRKILTIFVLAAFILGSMAYATNTRVVSMGVVPNVVKDEANIWLYPSTINYYPNLFIGEIGETGLGLGDELWSVGAHFGFGQDSDNPWVLGAYFSTEPYSHGVLASLRPWVVADQRLHLFYGRNFGEMPFGFAFGYFGSGSKNEDDDETNNMDQSLTRYEFVLGVSPMEGRLDVSLGLGFTTWKDEDYDAGSGEVIDVTKPSGNMDFGLIARYWMDPMGDWVFVPNAAFIYAKQGLEDAAGIEYTSTETEILFGMGMNYEADEDVLIVGDFGFGFDNMKDEVDGAESKHNFLILPYFKLGIDAYVTKWLDLRAGVIKEWVRETYEPTDVEKDVYGYADTWTFLGAGVHWGNFEIDAIINPEFLTNGPYFISGNATDDPGGNGDLARQISLKYNFD